MVQRDLEDLVEQYFVEKRFVEEESRYWKDLVGGTAFSGELRFEKGSYFPEAHYEMAFVEADDREFGEELLPDGGSKTQYYWSGEDGILYHTSKGEDMVVPFFNTVDDAEQFLENQASQHGKDRYSSMVLRKSGNRKVEEATDVLTEQSGIDDYW